MRPSREAPFTIPFRFCGFQNMSEIHPGGHCNPPQEQTFSKTTHAIKSFNLVLLPDLLSGPCTLGSSLRSNVLSDQSPIRTTKTQTT
jgi:hypothetical protein